MNSQDMQSVIEVSKKVYASPSLQIYGDLAQITRAVYTKGIDGGTSPKDGTRN